MDENLKIKSVRNLPTEHMLGGGTSMCAGCGGLGALHQIYDILGPNTIFVNAAGCMTLLASYPFTPMRSSWLYTSMASAPAGAQGVRDALDVLIRKKRLEKKEDMQVVVLTGDGSAYGMGLSSTSSAIERNLDFIYICYDNEGYGNTGQQSSDATPSGAHSATSENNLFMKKDLFAIWTAHRPTYAATVCVSESLDLAKKIEKAKNLKGPRLILALAPCPTGWDYSPEHSIDIGRLAVRTGVWPLKEFENGETHFTKIPRPRLPVEEYLKTQGRFRHLFYPQRDEAKIAQIQLEVDRLWTSAEKTAGGFH